MQLYVSWVWVIWTMYRYYTTQCQVWAGPNYWEISKFDKQLWNPIFSQYMVMTKFDIDSVIWHWLFAVLLQMHTKGGVDI